jgi:hypothetical protein
MESGDADTVEVFSFALYRLDRLERAAPTRPSINATEEGADGAAAKHNKAAAQITTGGHAGCEGQAAYENGSPAQNATDSADDDDSDY